MSSTETYGACVGMFELSRIKPRQHVIESIAEKVLEAARLGAQLLDEGDKPLYRQIPCDQCSRDADQCHPCDGTGWMMVQVWPEENNDEE